MNRHPADRAPEARAWPAWLEPLRPDEMTRRRIRKRVLASALPLLRARARSWHEVAARWSSVLAPLAAAIALVCATLALRAGRDEPLAIGDAVERTVPGVWEPFAGQPSESPPAFLTGASEPSRETVFTAAIARE